MIKLVTIKRALLFSALSFSPLVFSLQADYSPRFHDPLLLADHQILGKKQAINIAKSRHNGKVLSANLIRANSNSFYKIKLLDKKGRVKTIKVNATKQH